MLVRWTTLLFIGLLSLPVAAQTYRNIVNRPFATVSDGPQNMIIIDIDRLGRAPDAVDQAIREQSRRAVRAQIQAIRPLIHLWKSKGWVPQDFRLPIHQTVVLRRNGRLILPDRTRNGGLGNGTLTFQFQTTGDLFPANYQTLLQRVLNTATPLVEAEYGKPAQTRTITIVNYDDEIGDRDAVVGGIYDVSNNRFLFPIYNAPESAAVNLTHLVARAFHGGVQLAYDAWEEGFARAVTAKVARTSTFRSIAGLSVDFIEQTLENTYDARPYYDFWNQPSLSSPSFIAPSLRQGSIAGGTTGGLWLVRYLMAGSVWMKLQTEYPNFFKEFNNRFYGQYTAGLEGNVPQLIQIAKQTLSAISGSGNPTVEGIAFEDWYRRQFILDTSVTYGRKLHAQLFPYVSQVQPDEKAVFIVFLTYFQTTQTTNGWDESLLSGTCYPVYWDYQLNRLTLSPQYERVDIRVGSGSVVPSFIGDETANQRLTIDFAVGTESVRLAYPSSKVQGSNFQNDFFGVVYGLDNGSVKIELENGVSSTTPVVKGAFGVTLPGPGINRDQRATLTFKDSGGATVGTTRVNTGIGFQGVIVYLDNPLQSYRLQLPAGLHMVSLPLRPFTTDMAVLLGIPANRLMLAHWRQERFQYVYYPETPAPAPGTGYFLQLENPINVTIQGQVAPSNQNISLGLQVGWNLVGNPFNSAVRVADLLVAHTFEEPVSWEIATESIGGQPALVGSSIFTLNQSGGYTAVTQLEPGKAYWVRVLRPEGINLIVPPPSRSRSTTRSDTVSPAQWETRLDLSTMNGGQQVSVALGLDPRARNDYDSMDVESPPAFTDMLRLGIEQPSWGRAAGTYRRDVRSPHARQEWEITVRPLQPDETHILRWQMPNTNRRWRVTLYDPTTGEKIDMRTKHEYRFVPGSVRRLTVITEPVNRVPVQIVNLQTTVTRGSGVQAQFSLTGAATVRAEVRSMQGKSLRVLQPSRSAGAGVHSLTWNGRDTQERALPPGTYMLHVEATDEEGRVARAVRPVILAR